jgi:hypothetical protein
MAAVAIFLAIVLGMSAVHKFVAPERLGTAAAQLAGVPRVYGQMLSFSAAAIEGVAAVALLFQETRILGASLALGLWAGYAVLLWLRRGQSLDCGCSFGKREKPVGLSAIVRVACLAVLGMVSIMLPMEPVTVASLFAGLGFTALYLALDELMAIPQPAWRHG